MSSPRALCAVRSLENLRYSRLESLRYAGDSALSRRFRRPGGNAEGAEKHSEIPRDPPCGRSRGERVSCDRMAGGKLTDKISLFFPGVHRPATAEVFFVPRHYREFLK